MNSRHEPSLKINTLTIIRHIVADARDLSKHEKEKIDDLVLLLKQHRTKKWWEFWK